MNTKKPGIVLVVGATGSVGRHVVAEAVRQGYKTRALVRDASRAGRLDAGAQKVTGELTLVETLADAVAEIDAVIFTQGSSYGDAAAAETVDYGAVKNVIQALGGRRVRIALMTAIGVTRRGSTHDWKRRSERLVRASGNAYTIVRPGWFDYNDDDQTEIMLLQGDTRHAGSPADGVIARHQIARVLVDSLVSDASDRLTFELVAEHGPAQESLKPVFEALDKDPAGSLDGVRDQPNMPADAEPERVRRDLAALAANNQS
ncbi:SDR family oxidoreductase [Pseudarthrobacter sp. MDT3-28]|uniref:SDR family oxidoreductase n=1 Tax=Pseudarthrobacter raffinosi TaxID=2953651 RepID=UPI00208EF2D9|nr:SDR family oxidoreductase [Pseudarthrobacter sp. MDT3-28]MCO4239343.1 SDR family oxidoreductase [Pseudarthrobacter sp. MDT3-28]